MFQTDKPINIAQLAYELGEIPARWRGPDDNGVTVMEPAEGATLTQDAWDAAVAAHVLDDGWTQPGYEAPPSKAEKVETVIEALGLTDGPADALRELMA